MGRDNTLGAETAGGRGEPPGRAVGIAVALVALALPGVGGWLYAVNAPHVDIIAIELGGSGQPPLPDGATTALWWDFVFIACYGAGLLLGTTAARWVATSRGRRIAWFGLAAAVVAVVADVGENILLLVQVAWLLDVATAAAVLKFAALLPAAAVALSGVGVVLWRAVTFTPPRPGVLSDVWPGEPLELDDPPATVDTDPGDAARWRAGYRVPDVDPADVQRRFAQGDDTVGFCLSGGGIRAASVAMGALQTLRSELLGARYLVSVSGGGYTAGALQQSLTGAVRDPRFAIARDVEVLREPEHAYQHGTAEENHVRRRSAYLADTPWEVVTALGVVARGLLLSLFMLFAPAVVLGVLAGWFYQAVPITPIGDVVARPRVGALYLLVALVVLTFLLSLFGHGAAAGKPEGRWARQAATGLTWLTLVVAALTLVVPSLIGVVASVLSRTGMAVEVGGPVGTVVLTYVATLVAVLWKHRTTIRNSRDAARAVTGAVPSGLLQRVFVVLTTALLGLAWLLLFAGSATTSGEAAALWTALGVGVALLVVGFVFDETSLSLHPFYRERLARTFAVRTVRRERDGRVVAVPYPSTERTSLSTYGTVKDGLTFPEVIFAAAAHLTGESRTPPGLNCVSYTMSARWVGGPDVGWVATRQLEDVVTTRFRRDLTVQGAVAISGAAFASSMGRAARWYQVLLAVSGARLGTWLPNPGFLHAARQASAEWTRRRLPVARRLPYLLKEIFGIHPYADRLLHVTDGGHYDNLGLVELFRRRCTKIYCIDASADEPPTATALAEALRLARHELGVQVVLDQIWPSDAEPGSGTPLPPEDPLATLNARLVKNPIITGTVLYPPESGLDGVTGRIVIAKARLWPELPYSLLSYAAKHPEFPHDSTGDQWFGEGKFSAYTELGRRLGERALHPAAAPAAEPAAPAAAREAAVAAESARAPASSSEAAAASSSP
ncbi:patatin-like phospholipase family protein [Haloechinothrix salitolerans]|uniref:Patatin-like phospholipase family protein n=1 Tax=Haloechinothrix salitolerans TaxID=926830 RepID=A0ABW2BWU3_9PSEU